MHSSIVRYAGKVDGTLDILKGILAGILAEKLCVAITHAEIENKVAVYAPEDGSWAAMGSSWPDVAPGNPQVRWTPLK